VVADDFHQRRQVLCDAFRLDVTALPDGEVDAVESDVCRRARQVFAAQELQVFGEDSDFEFSGGRCGTGKQHGDCGE